MNKKGITWQQLAIAIITIVAVLLIIMWFRTSGERAKDFVGNKIGDLETDTDGDGIVDAVDQCSGAENSQKDVTIDSKGCEIREEAEAS